MLKMIAKLWAACPQTCYEFSLETTLGTWRHGAIAQTILSPRANRPQTTIPAGTGLMSRALNCRRAAARRASGQAPHPSLRRPGRVMEDINSRIGRAWPVEISPRRPRRSPQHR
jgi:hypothetical protein